jgi:Protein of unknown function, DUF488
MSDAERQLEPLALVGMLREEIAEVCCRSVGCCYLNQHESFGDLEARRIVDPSAARRQGCDFDRYLRTQAELLAALVEQLAGAVALLCYERDHTQCHRSAVAGALSAITGI